MINLRYHIVSLVAVFLAMALGIVIGSTVLKEGADSATVRILRATSRELQVTSEAVRADNDHLKAINGASQRFGDAVLPDLVHGRLSGRPLVLIDTDKVDDGTRSAVRRALQLAGAQVDAQLTFSTQRLALTNSGDLDNLGKLLGITDAGSQALRGELVNQLSARLADGRARELVDALSKAKFLSSLKLSGPLKQATAPLPQQGAAFVLLGPTDPTPTLGAGDFLVPLAGGLGQLSQPVAAAERADGTASWLQALRGDKEVSQRVASVDDADLTPGQVALVVALQRRLDSGAVGDYGIKQGSDGVLPERTGTS